MGLLFPSGVQHAETCSVMYFTSRFSIQRFNGCCSSAMPPRACPVSRNVPTTTSVSARAAAVGRLCAVRCTGRREVGAWPSDLRSVSRYGPVAKFQASNHYYSRILATPRDASLVDQKVELRARSGNHFRRGPPSDRPVPRMVEKIAVIGRGSASADDVPGSGVASAIAVSSGHSREWVSLPLAG